MPWLHWKCDKCGVIMSSNWALGHYPLRCRCHKEKKNKESK